MTVGIQFRGKRYPTDRATEPPEQVLPTVEGLRTDFSEIVRALDDCMYEQKLPSVEHGVSTIVEEQLKRGSSASHDLQDYDNIDKDWPKPK